MKMDSNTILITGGASGIGFELAKRFLVLGNTVLITGRNREKLEQARAGLPGVHIFQGDVGDPASIEALHREVVSRFPRLNVLINNAGIMRNLDLGDSSADLTDLVQEIETNLSGSIRMVHRFLPTLRSNSKAAIVNVSSGLAFIPFVFAPVYGATKAGIHSYTQSLRQQLKGSGVEVFELAPPATATGLSAAFGPGAGTGEMSTQKMLDFALKELAKGKSEILPGAARVLKLMSRVAPTFFFHRLSAVFARMVTRPPTV